MATGRELRLERFIEHYPIQFTDQIFRPILVKYRNGELTREQAVTKFKEKAEEMFEMSLDQIDAATGRLSSQKKQ